MKKFDYITLNNLVLNPTIVKKLNLIYELQGKMENLILDDVPVLQNLVEVAKIQSTDASNRIEGIYTSSTRLKQLVKRSTQPKNRSEEEISGYRDVLELIHENYANIPINANSILALHKKLFNFTASDWGGHFKDINNQIITTYADGQSEVRFNPPPAYLTHDLIIELCEQYSLALSKTDFSPLVLTAAFIFDFVLIHPFRDGNGRMSRLLMLLTLYQNKFFVGKYISIEQLIERTKTNYYSALESSSVNWMENTNSYENFLDYFLSIVLQAYRDLADRVLISKDEKISATTLIMRNLQDKLIPLTKNDLVELTPQYSQVTIERNLRLLLADGKIAKIGKGRATKYVLAK